MKVTLTGEMKVARHKVRHQTNTAHYIYKKPSGTTDFLTYEDKQDPDRDLQTEGDADESDEGGVEGEVSPLFQHCLQL